MAKFLVIGSTGTVGTEFTKLIPPQDLVVGNRPEVDITNTKVTKNFIREQKPEIIINCAAYTNVDEAENTPALAKIMNHEALENISKAANDVDALLVHFSTGMVFAGTNPNGYNEDDATDPVNMYGRTKLDGEKIIQNKCHKYYIVRSEWLYGKPAEESAKQSFVELMIRLAESGTVKGVTDEVGRPTWAKDLAIAVLAMLESKPGYGIYHLVNEGQASRAEWAREIYKIKKIGVNVEPVSGSQFPRPAPRPPYELLNNTKLPKLRSWQEALKEYLTN